MRGPTRTARIAYALALGFSWAGPPALAQVAASHPIKAWPYVTHPDTAQTTDPRSAEAWPDATPPADAARAAASRPVEAWPYVTPSGDAAQAADVPAADAPPADELQIDPALPPYDPAAEPPLVDAPSADATDAAGAADALAEEPQAVEAPSGIAALLAHWITTSGDSGGRPFIIVDKVAADIFVFDPDGLLRGGAPVLVGLAPGDDSAAGVGDRDLSAITPEERTTPAGRFVAQFGYASGDKKVLWVDYADAISLHPVVTTNRKERRLQRIRSSDPEDHRISYGCINVPAGFYRDVVLTTLGDGGAVVYVLPESKPVADVFPEFAIATGISAAADGATASDVAQRKRDADAATSPWSTPEAAADDAGAKRAPASETMRTAPDELPASAPEAAAADQGGPPAPTTTLFGP